MSATLAAGDARYVRLKEYLIEQTGLAYYRDRDDELVHRIGVRLQASQARDCGEYLETLCASGGAAELDLLIAELTIGETYFFRHPEQFDALRARALPDILKRNRDSGTVRVWSAGCANGAETYSLSILLRDEAPGPAEGWNVSVVGTDVNRRSLAQARRGRYESWALRVMAGEARGRYFLPDEGGWTIRDRYRQGVAFQYHNLVRHAVPSRLDNLFAFDLILCRNVTIYFDRATAAVLTRRLWDSLAEGGWLAVGHADIDPEAFQAFEAVQEGGTTLFRKGGAPPPAQAAPLWTVFEPAVLPPWLPPAVPPPPPPESPPARTGIEEVRELADGGAWTEAVRRCAALLEAAPLDGALHFYHGLILAQMGRSEEAERSLRRSIYLDRRSALSHYHLGLLLQRHASAPGPAQRCFHNVLALLEEVGDGFQLAHGDGVTAASLRELTKAHIEALGA